MFAVILDFREAAPDGKIESCPVLSYRGDWVRCLEYANRVHTPATVCTVWPCTQALEDRFPWLPLPDEAAELLKESPRKLVDWLARLRNRLPVN